MEKEGGEKNFHFQCCILTTCLPEGKLQHCLQWPKKVKDASETFHCEWLRLTPLSKSRCLTNFIWLCPLPWQSRQILNLVQPEMPGLQHNPSGSTSIGVVLSPNTTIYQKENTSTQPTQLVTDAADVYIVMRKS